MQSTSRRTALLALILGAGAAAFVASPAVAGEPRGPAFGSNRYAAEIENDPGEPDCDDYVGFLAKGETISVTLTLPKGSGLVPNLSIVGPDGHARPARLLTLRGGKTLAIRGHKTDVSGLWVVRVLGAAESEGPYGLAFQSPAKPRQVREKAASQAGVEAGVPFEAVEGTTADIAVTWKKGAKPAEIVSVLDPEGGDALARAGGASLVRVKGTTASVKGLVLTEGHGAYELRLAGADGAAVAAQVSIVLRPPVRPVGTKVSTLGREPYLNALPAAIDGIAGKPVRITGARLAPGVRFFFGANEATNVTFFGGATEVVALAPPGVPGQTVALAAVAPDGQVSARANGFRYVPAPVFTDVTRLDGTPISAYSRFGGIDVRITGDKFRTGQKVRFPGSVDVSPTVVSANELVVRIPVTPPAVDHLFVFDEWNQSGRSPQPFEMKTPPAFAALPYTPSVAAVDQSVDVVIRGAFFEIRDVLLVDGAEVQSHFIDTSNRRFRFEGRGVGKYRVQLRDRIGMVVDGPTFNVKRAPEVAAVAVLDGQRIGTNGIPPLGGNTIRVSGDSFDVSDLVTLGGTTIRKTASTDTSFEFVAPPGAAGDADLVILDGADQSTTVAGAVRYEGFYQATSARTPSGSAVDDFGARRAVVGDLDGNGCDDLVIGSPAGSVHGSRRSLTRLLLNDGSGVLEDATADRFPSASGDDWYANGLALSDLDGDDDLDLVAVGAPPDPKTASGIRVFTNDGYGGFSLNANASPRPTAHDLVTVYVQWMGNQTAATACVPGGDPQAVAIGDVDGDDAPDLLVGWSGIESETRYIPASIIDYSRSPPYVQYYAWYNTRGQRESVVRPGTRLYSNAGGRFVDASQDTMPDLSAGGTTPALVSRDLALADLDGDGDLDLVVAWDNPATVTVDGQSTPSSTPTVATRVLLNDGGGGFSDRTSNWMPSGSGNEYWQADRIALADLDGDGDPDLVLSASQGVDAWKADPTHTATALRILRNDGSRFTNVTATAVPALPAGDDWRASAIVVRDLDGDGYADLLLATPDSLSSGTVARRSTRFLRQTSALRFQDGGGFLPAVADDTGEAEDLVIGDLAGDGTPTLLLLGRQAPAESEGGAKLRAFDWKR